MIYQRRVVGSFDHLLVLLFLNTQSGIIPLEVTRFTSTSVVFVFIVVVVGIFIAGIVTMAAVVIRVGIVTKRRSRHC